MPGRSVIPSRPSWRLVRSTTGLSPGGRRVAAQALVEEQHARRVGGTAGDEHDDARDGVPRVVVRSGPVAPAVRTMRATMHGLSRRSSWPVSRLRSYARVIAHGGPRERDFKTTCYRAADGLWPRRAAPHDFPYCQRATAGVYPRLTMALIKCADCGKEMSSEAPACPSCGKPNAATVAKKKTSTRDAGCLLMVLGLLGSLFVPGSLQVFMWGLLFVGLVIAVLGMVKK